MNRPTEKQIEAAMELSTGFGLFRQCGSMKVATSLSNDEVRALSASLAVEAGAGTEWTYKIQHGPDGEANYAWVYRGQEMVATMKTHHARAVCSALTPASSAVEGEAVAEPKFGRLFRSKTPLEVDRDPVHRRVQRELKPLRDAIIKGSSPAPTPAGDAVAITRRTVERPPLIIEDEPAPTPAGDGLQAAVDRWADALRKCEAENTRSAGHALDAAEETLLSFASPAPHQEGRADG